MIITEKVKIKVNNNLKEYYTNKGYDVSGGIIYVPPTDLPKGSNEKIICKCDICGHQKELNYRRYLRSVGNGGYYSCSTKCAQNKVKNTFIEKYGHEHHFQSEGSKTKIKETFIKNYGTKHFTHSEEYQNRVVDIVTKRKNNIDTQYLHNEGMVSIEGDTFTLYCEHHDGEYTISRKLYHNRKRCKINTCTVCYPLNENVSIKEIELRNFIGDHVEITPNYKVGGKEIDVFVPSLNVGFEFNGLYWHSEEFQDNDYHQFKTKLCLENNVQLIHIYEDDWDNNREVVKSRILNLLGVNRTKYYGRKCVIKELTPKVYRKFCVDNHIQGSVNAKIKLGLFHESELVSVMSFGQLRSSLGHNSKDGYWEMLRFCNKMGTNVIGGASKLFKYFIKVHNPTNVISYADRSWSKGDLYNTLGFELVSETKPNYHYIIDKIRYNRYNFRKDKLVSEGYDNNSTERQIMLDRGIRRIYDSGSLKFIYKKTP